MSLALLFAALPTIGWAADDATAWRFAALGDAPYSDLESAQTREVLRAAAARGNRFAVHVGDLKSGSEPCSDDLLEARRALLDASALPLVFVFGDNEWTDCHRHRAGGFDPLERLERLRSLFYPSARSLGRPAMALERQSDVFAEGLPEHVRWRHRGVSFATLDVAGSGDGTRAGRDATREHLKRRAAVLAWLADTYRQARARGDRMVVLFAHANVEFETDFRPRGPRPGVIDPYLSLRRALLEHARDFSGQTLLVHGDTHRFRVDRPFEHLHALSRFVRVEVSGWPDVSSWVELEVRESTEPGQGPTVGVALRRLDQGSVTRPVP